MPFGVFLLGSFLILGYTISSGAALPAMDAADTLPADQAAEAAYAEADNTPDASAGLTAVTQLIGKKEADLVGLLGRGATYTTADGFAQIGRIYDMTLYREPVTVFALIGNKRTVEAVSVRIADTVRPTAEQDRMLWQERITAYTGTEMLEASPAASGMQCWEWRTPHTVFTLRLLDGTLTLHINPAVGELQ